MSSDRLAIAVSAVALIFLVSACNPSAPVSSANRHGSPPPAATATTAPTATGTTAGSGGEDSCDGTVLALSIDDSGGAPAAGAGNDGTDIVLKNQGQTSCVMYGYANLAAPGQPVQTAHNQEAMLIGAPQGNLNPPQEITLRPEESAYIGLEWTEPGLHDRTTIDTLLVTPPGQHTAAAVETGGLLCAQPASGTPPGYVWIDETPVSVRPIFGIS